MEQLILDMFEAAKKDPDKLKAFKSAAVKCNQFELAANLRGMEQKLFPESEEDKKAKESASKLNLIFRMVELNIPEDVCFLINSTLKRYWKRKGNFDLKDASELIYAKKKIFRE